MCARLRSAVLLGYGWNSIQFKFRSAPLAAPPLRGWLGGAPPPPPPPPPLALLARTRATSRGKAGAKRGARACGKVNFDPHCFAGNANLEIPPSQKYINVFVGSHREPSCFAARKQRSGRVSAPPSWQGRGLVGARLRSCVLGCARQSCSDMAGIQFNSNSGRPPWPRPPCGGGLGPPPPPTTTTCTSRSNPGDFSRKPGASRRNVFPVDGCHRIRLRAPVRATLMSLGWIPGRCAP